MNDKYDYDNMKKVFDDNRNENTEEAKDFYMVSFDEELPILKKEISEDKRKSTIKNAALALAVSLGLAAGAIQFMDMVKHPENWLTTHPNFEGTTISEILKRTPENFGLGGK